MSEREDDPVMADELLDRLAGELPALDVDDMRRQRIRAAAHAELARQRRLQAMGWLRPLRRAYRLAEPVLVAVVASTYLVWAYNAVMIAYR